MKNIILINTEKSFKLEMLHIFAFCISYIHSFSISITRLFHPQCLKCWKLLFLTTKCFQDDIVVSITSIPQSSYDTKTFQLKVFWIINSTTHINHFLVDSIVKWNIVPLLCQHYWRINWSLSLQKKTPFCIIFNSRFAGGQLSIYSIEYTSFIPLSLQKVFVWGLYILNKNV